MFNTFDVGFVRVNLRFLAYRKDNTFPSHRRHTITRVRNHGLLINDLSRLGGGNIRPITRFHIQYRQRKRQIYDCRVSNVGRANKRVINTQRQRTIQRLTIRYVIKRIAIPRITKVMRRIVQSRVNSLTLPRVFGRPLYRNLSLQFILTIVNRLIRPLVLDGIYQIRHVSGRL